MLPTTINIIMHQFLKVLSLNCAEIIKDKDMNTHLLSSLINKIINTPQRRESIKETLKKEYINNPVERIFKHIEASR